ncbi:MAG TPA: TonB family protein [Vicinamibacterales bacterium]|nr:TonB family protein [Acidobacteriota bacterium]HOC17381.1 TonB family protein [Vicinamibacterales bacterium]
MDSVTAIVLERAREPRSMRPMVAASIALHVLALALLMVRPDPFSSENEDAARSLMTISLGNGGGPDAGGANTLGARPVQRAAAQPEPLRAPQAPAARTPEMVLPSRVVKPRPGAKPAPERPAVRNAPEEAAGRTPTTGPEERFGSAMAETGGYEFGSGLTSGGGGGTGGYLDVGNFCCPDYLITMRRLIQSNWNARQGVEGSVVVKFVIQRDGRLTDVEVEERTGLPALDLTAERAIVMTRQLPPLPAPFPDRSLTVHLRFNYRR